MTMKDPDMGDLLDQIMYQAATIKRHEDTIKHLQGLVEEIERREKRSESRSISAQCLYQASTHELLNLRGAVRALLISVGEGGPESIQLTLMEELRDILDTGTIHPKGVTGP